MAASAAHNGLRLISVVGMDGTQVLTASLLPSATVGELQEHIFEVAGVKPLAQRLVYAGKMLCAEATLEEVGLGDGALISLVVTFEAVEYRVLLGRLLKRPGEDPQAPNVVEEDHKVGSRLRTTGRTWVSPLGALWVELDPSTAEPGWLLVRGARVQRAGTLLVRGDQADHRAMLLRSYAAGLKGDHRAGEEPRREHAHPQELDPARCDAAPGHAFQGGQRAAVPVLGLDKEGLSRSARRRPGCSMGVTALPAHLRLYEAAWACHRPCPLATGGARSGRVADAAGRKDFGGDFKTCRRRKGG